MYEIAILGNDKFSWQMTESSPNGITDKLVSKNTFNAMLVPVAIEGKKAAPQHIFYRQEKLTNDELAEINAAWLKQNATLININALKTIVKQPLLPRKQAATQSTSETSQAQNHKVRTNDDGSPEQ
ncbi:hypothetical protein [Vibrio campbellii]|uniref:hypothetical protein n=1 Tax=Vibrio campbellii TaxID=680 RepID=UPI00210904CD|nr:hypothetical protein [Vibrio campbellii]